MVSMTQLKDNVAEMQKRRGELGLKLKALRDERKEIYKKICAAKKVIRMREKEAKDVVPKR